MKRILFDHLEPRPRLAARTLHVLDWHGALSKRALERKMNASKYPFWDEAWQMLMEKKCIQLEYGSRRRVIVTLIEIPTELQARTIVKRPKRKRQPTEWFKQRLPDFLERDGYGANDEDRE
jgi:hypothetical protein